MVLDGLQKDIKSFISGRDLIMFATGIALSNQFQTTVKTVIDEMIMPVVSSATGVGKLAARSWNFQGITLGWGAAAQAVIVFLISLVIMVKVAKYITVKLKVESTSVKFT